MKISALFSIALVACAAAAPGGDNDRKPGKKCAKVGEECMDSTDCCSNHCGPRIMIWPPVPGKCEAAETTTTGQTPTAVTWSAWSTTAVASASANPGPGAGPQPGSGGPGPKAGDKPGKGGKGHA